MGCDIHLHVEIHCEGKWEHWAHPSVIRWYELFGKMAGVRGDEDPIVEPRGFPPDASLATRLDYEHEGLDAHTPSWLNTEEIIQLETWLKAMDEKRNPAWPGFDLEAGILSGTYLFGNSLTAKWRFVDVDYAPGVDAVRLVFWFDN